MRPSSIPDNDEPCSDHPRKKLRLDCSQTDSALTPLAFNSVDCRNEETVCYGMVWCLRAFTRQQPLMVVQIHGLTVLTQPDSTTREPCGTIPINLHRDLTLRRKNGGGIVGSLEKDIFVALEKLAHERIEFQLSVTRSDDSDTQRRRMPTRGDLLWPETHGRCRWCVYGRMRLFSPGSLRL
jgi:hypothetical protein